MGVGGSLVGLVLEGEFEVGTGAVVEVGEVLLVHGVDGFGEDGGDGLAALVGLGLDHLLEVVEEELGGVEHGGLGREEDDLDLVGAFELLEVFLLVQEAGLDHQVLALEGGAARVHRPAHQSQRLVELQLAEDVIVEFEVHHSGGRDHQQVLRLLHPAVAHLELRGGHLAAAGRAEAVAAEGGAAAEGEAVDEAELPDEADLCVPVLDQLEVPAGEAEPHLDALGRVDVLEGRLLLARLDVPHPHDVLHRLLADRQPHALLRHHVQLLHRIHPARDLGVGEVPVAVDQSLDELQPPRGHLVAVRRQFSRGHLQPVLPVHEQRVLRVLVVEVLDLRHRDVEVLADVAERQSLRVGPVQTQVVLLEDPLQLLDHLLVDVGAPFAGLLVGHRGARLRLEGHLGGGRLGGGVAPGQDLLDPLGQSGLLLLLQDAVEDGPPLVVLLLHLHESEHVLPAPPRLPLPLLADFGLSLLVLLVLLVWLVFEEGVLEVLIEVVVVFLLDEVVEFEVESFLLEFFLLEVQAVGFFLADPLEALVIGVALGRFLLDLFALSLLGLLLVHTGCSLHTLLPTSPTGSFLSIHPPTNTRYEQHPICKHLYAAPTLSSQPHRRPECFRW